MQTRLSRIDALEPRRLFALANAGGVSSTVTGNGYQSIDATVFVPGGYVVAGTFGEEGTTDFGNGLPRVTPRGSTDLFISVVKGSSASLLTLGGGDGDDGEPRFEDDRADYTGAPERVEDGETFFPLNARAAEVDEYVTAMKLGPDGKLYVSIAFRREISLNTRDGKAATLKPAKEFEDDLFDSAVLRYTIDGANLRLDRTLQIGGPFNDIIYDFDFAPDGDLIVAGSFERRADFQPGKGSYILNPAGRGDSFVARYGSKNKLEWVRQFGGDEEGGQDLEAAYAIDVVDDGANGKVYVGGAFAEDAEFDRRDRLSDDGQDDDGDENVRIEAQDRTDGYTLRLDAAEGDLDWVVSQGGDEFDAIRDIVVDASGRVFTLGYFQDEADLDASPDRERIFTAAENDDVVTGRGEDTDLFFTRLDATGKQVWVQQLVGEGRELIGSLTAEPESGTITIAGSFAGTLDTDPTARRNRITSNEVDVDDRNGDRDYAYAGFIASYRASNGSRASAVKIDGQRDQDVFITDAARRSSGEFLIAGRFRGGLEAEPIGLRVTASKKPRGRDDGFAAIVSAVV